MPKPGSGWPLLRGAWRRWVRVRHALWHPYPPIWASRVSLFGALLVPAVAAAIILPMELGSREQNVTITVPASQTPLTRFGADPKWEIDVGGKLRAVWKPLAWKVTITTRWEALVDPASPGPVRPPSEVLTGAPPLETYLGPHLDKKRAELNTSGWWRLGLTPIDDETLQAITIDMVRSGATTRYLFVVWQVPVVLTAAAMLAAAIYFSIAARARDRKRRAVERAASASETGKCPECDYPTAGLDSGICPECGWNHAKLKHRLEVLRRRYRRDRRVRPGGHLQDGRIV